ncbi:MAG TPA: rubrerythrin family protein [Acidobacteriota bacterium]|nr:rubrerythrin family protein [Acidobacteriota bacterium]
MSQTKKNIEEAFAGESQARNKYTYFAEKAKEEGYHYIAKIFKETAANEMEHARDHFKLMGEPGSTEENLKQAVEGEHYETVNMYPQFAKQAREDGNKKAAILFEQIAKIEENHKKRYQKLLEMVQNGTVFKREKPIRWKCSVCGYTMEGKEPPPKCPSCKNPKEYYEPANMDF